MSISTLIKGFKVLNYAFLLLFCGYTIVTYFQFPEVVPIHFNLSGEADGFGSKNMNWFLVLVGTALFFFMQYCAKNPYTPGLNIPETLRNNKELTNLFCQVICLIILILFLDIQYESVEVAQHRQKEISHLTLFLIGFMFIVMFGFFIYAKNRNRTK